MIYLIAFLCINSQNDVSTANAYSPAGLFVPSFSTSTIRGNDGNKKLRFLKSKNYLSLSDNDFSSDYDIDEPTPNGSSADTMKLEVETDEKKEEEVQQSPATLATDDDDDPIGKSAVEGDMCRLIEFDHDEEDYQDGTPLFDRNSLVAAEAIFQWLPLLFPIMAYVLYDPTASAFASVLDILNSSSNWIAVDGGAYQAKIIAPAINGIVVPAISILFATLVGTTITTLRQRQVTIRNSINIEANQLRILHNLLDSFVISTTITSTTTNGIATNGYTNGYVNGDNNDNNGSDEEDLILDQRNKCRYYLYLYTSRLIAEGHETINLESLDLSGMDSELNGVLVALNTISSLSSSLSSEQKHHKQQRNAAVIISPPPAVLIGEGYSACRRLYDERSNRITALQSTFPVLHYVILTALAVSICAAFLMETAQEILVFLNAIQLRLLWSMLVANFCALAVVMYDLRNPFRGSYQVSESLQQLYTIRLNLRSALQRDKEGRECIIDYADDYDGSLL